MRMALSNMEEEISLQEAIRVLPMSFSQMFPVLTVSLTT